MPICLPSKKSIKRLYISDISGRIFKYSTYPLIPKRGVGYRTRNSFAVAHFLSHFTRKATTRGEEHKLKVSLVPHLSLSVFFSFSLPLPLSLSLSLAHSHALSPAEATIATFIAFCVKDLFAPFISLSFLVFCLWLSTPLLARP